jgi:hypothetical protein
VVDETLLSTICVNILSRGRRTSRYEQRVALEFEVLEDGVVCLVLVFSGTLLDTPAAVVGENPTTRQRRFDWPMARRLVALTD